MDKLILRLQGLSANDYANLHTSIVQDLQKIHIIIIPHIPAGAEGVNLDNEAVEIIEANTTKIDNKIRIVIHLIKSGQLNDHKYHTDVAKLYEVVKNSEKIMIFGSSQITVFCHLYINHYIINVVKPYNLSLLIEAIYVIKNKTPIVDDNICDILTFLNDETYFTKHQVDSEIYSIA
jgi:hypothetical protein